MNTPSNSKKVSFSRQDKNSRRQRALKDRQIVSLTRQIDETLQKSIDDTDFIVFDLETTGGNPERNGITEIYALHYKEGKVFNDFHSMVNPKRNIPRIVREITGISNQMVRHAPTIQQVMPSFLDFIGDKILVSHNIIGDLIFLKHFSRVACKVQLENKYLCTHLLTELLIPESPSKSLGGLVDYLNLPKDTMHRAKADALATLELFKVLLKKLSNRFGDLSLEDTIRTQGEIESCLKLGWAIDRSFDELPEKPGLLRFLDIEHNVLFTTSSYNIKKTAFHLEKSPAKLARPLVKKLLKSHDFSFKVLPDILTAMHEESIETDKKNLSYPAFKWHLRYITTFYIKVLNEKEILMGIGQLSPGVNFAVGPIHDKKEALNYLKDLADFFSVNLSRQTITLAKEEQKALVSLLDNSKKLTRFLNVSKIILSLLWNINKSGNFKNIKSLIKILRNQYLKKHTVLSQENGVIRCYDEQEKKCRIYPVINGSAKLNPMIFKDWKSWLKSKQCQEFLLEIKKKDSTGDKAISLSSKAEANIMNQTLWMIYGKTQSKKNKNFFSVKDISKQ
ncbi:MAG: hypothetical protein CMP11_07505 [Zetaproteobacteria bacterium]|nr:hypothetical protein [Pseudobdellovibrionaceae bacterium]